MAIPLAPYGDADEAPSRRLRDYLRIVYKYRWLTVVSAQAPDGPQLLLEPDAHPAAKPFKAALVADGVPYTTFTVDDVRMEMDRLRGLGVRVVQEPAEMGPVVTAVIDDTCGNLIMLSSARAA